MTSKRVKLLHNVIAQAITPVGFKKKGSAWYCQEAEAVLVISPQRSQYGLRYYLNLGVYWRILGEKMTPKVRECQLRSRIESILPQEKKHLVEHCLDFEDASIDDSTRHAVLLDALSLHAIPVLKRCATEEGLRDEYNSGLLVGFLIDKKLVAALGL